MRRAYELIGYKPPDNAFRAMEGFRKTQSLRRGILDHLSELFPSQLRIIRRPRQSWRQGVELDNHVQIAIHICHPLRQSLDGPRWLLKGNCKEENMVSLICLTNGSVSGFAGLYVVPEIGSSLKRYKVLREDHPLLRAGKRLGSLSEFYEAAKTVSEGWRAQCDFIVLGDATFQERTSLLVVANRKIKLSRIESLIVKALLENADRSVSLATLSSYARRPTEWFARCHISALRKKLGKKVGRRVITVKGEGYLYDSGLGSV